MNIVKLITIIHNHYSYNTNKQLQWMTVCC